MIPTLTDRLHKAKFVNRKQLAADVAELEFVIDGEGLTFVSGQYIWLVLPELSSEPGVDRRAFSISSSPDQLPTIKLLLRSSDTPYNQKILQLTPESPVQMIGPFGESFCLGDATPSNLVMVSGGVGLAPFMSVLRSADERLHSKLVRLIRVNRQEQPPLYEEELADFAQKNLWLQVIPTYYEEIPDESLITNDPSQTEYWICGSMHFVSRVSDQLDRLQISPHQRRYENNYPPVAGELTPELVDQALKDMQTATATKENAFYLAVLHSTHHTIITDTNGRIVFANPAAQRITGYTFAEMKGQTPRLWGGLHDSSTYKTIWRMKETLQPFEGEVQNRRKNGDLYTAIAHISPILNQQNQLIGFVANEEDISVLKEVDRMKSEFISLASHQLRTPLSTIRWYCELLTDSLAKTANSDQSEYLHTIDSATQRMIDLVNSLLNISRIESGTFRIDPISLKVIEIWQTVLADVQSQIEEKNIAILAHVEDSIPAMSLDPNLTHIILLNLLTNAIKYSHEGGEVRVDIRIASTDETIGGKKLLVPSLIVQVQDHGIGIPHDQQSQMFSKLFRANNARVFENSGDGLGLYLVKSVLTEAGGDIWFESSENQGSTFYIAIPQSGMKQREGARQLEPVG